MEKAGVIKLLIILICILLIIFVAVFVFKYNSSSTVSFPACANYTGEVLDNCISQEAYKLARANNNTSICEKYLKDQALLDCVDKTALALVAIDYYENSKSDLNYIPSNLELCDKISVKEKEEYCKNYKQVVADCGGVFCYYY